MLLENLIENNLTLKAGYLHIASGASVSVSKEDEDHPTILDAISKGWARLVDMLPDDGIPEPDVTVADPVPVAETVEPVVTPEQQPEAPVVEAVVAEAVEVKKTSSKKTSS